MESKRAPWLVLALAALVVLPSIQVGFYNDDHIFRAALSGRTPLAPPWWDLYRFATGEPAENQRAIESGLLPSWSAPGFRLHLIRPLASASIALDYALFRDAALGYHLHSIAWYLGLVAAVGLLLRTALPRNIALLAMLLYAVSTAHFFPFAWPSCRHMPMAALPATLGVVAYLRLARAGPWLLALGVAVGLGASETALSILGFPVAHTLMNRSRPWRQVSG